MFGLFSEEGRLTTSEVGSGQYNTYSVNDDYRQDNDIHTLGDTVKEIKKPRRRRTIIYSNVQEVHKLIDSKSKMVLTLDGELRQLGIAIIMSRYKLLSTSPLIIKPGSISGIALPNKVELVVVDPLLKFMFSYRMLSTDKSVTNVLTLLKGVRDGVMPLLIDYLDNESIRAVESTLLSDQFLELIRKHYKTLKESLGVSPLVLLGIEDDTVGDDNWDIDWGEEVDNDTPSVVNPHKGNRNALYTPHVGQNISSGDGDEFDFSIPRELELEFTTLEEEED